MEKSNKHKGKIVESVVRNSDFNISFIAKRLKKNRGTLYRWFDIEDLGWDKILKIGEILNHDFSIEFPEMIPSYNKDEIILNEPKTSYEREQNILTLSSVKAMQNELFDIYVRLHQIINKFDISKIDFEKFHLLDEKKTEKKDLKQPGNEV